MNGDGGRDEILVAGGGIGGLAAAIALARIGTRVRVLERAASFSAAGAGIQLGPNATRILEEWGVWEKLKGDRVAPQALHIHDGINGTRLASVPLGETQARYGAPYGAVHRADLQRALLAGARSHGEIAIARGFEVAAVAQSGAGVAVTSHEGQRLEGAGLIGADGMRSTVRRELGLGPEPAFAGKTAWRALLPPGEAPAGFGPREIGLWLGPGAHLVHYAVKGGAKLNLVAVIGEDWAHEGWDAAGDEAALLPHFASWAAAARALLEGAGDWRKWALAAMAPLPRWGEGRITLLGDAAHPVLPFLAQGGAMAIEDAARLAREVGRGGGLARAFERYAQARGPRTARVQARSRRQGEIYHMGGLKRLARNLVLGARSSGGLLKELDWLYRAPIEEA